MCVGCVYKMCVCVCGVCIRCVYMHGGSVRKVLTVV
jgi:hypothetical protein